MLFPKEELCYYYMEFEEEEYQSFNSFNIVCENIRIVPSKTFIGFYHHIGFQVFQLFGRFILVHQIIRIVPKS